MTAGPDLPVAATAATDDESNRVPTGDGDAHSRALVPDGAAASWAGLPPGERRRRAMRAALERDSDTLWDLTQAQLTQHGRHGARVSPHTLAQYRVGVRHLLDAWGQVDLLHPDRDAGAAWVRALESTPRPRPRGPARPFTPATVQVYLAAARTLYAALRWAGATTADPFDAVRPAPDPTPPWEKRAPYAPDELDTLLRATEVADAFADRVLVLLGAHAGLRVSEALALRWADVDLRRRRLRVRAGKGGQARTVALSRSLIDALGRLQGATTAAAPATVHVDVDHVLPYRDAATAQRRLAALCIRAGVPYRGVHALRHSCGTRFVAESGNLEGAARHLGHRHIQTTRSYLHWAEDAGTAVVGDW